MDEANKPDNIEKLVNEAAEGAKFDFNAEAWSAMEAKLDGKSWKVGAWWKFGLPILLVVLAIIFWPKNGVDSSNAEPVKQEIGNQADKNVPETEIASTQEDRLEEENDKEELNTILPESQASENSEGSSEGVTQAVAESEKNNAVIQNDRPVTNRLKSAEQNKIEYFSAPTQPNDEAKSIVTENDESEGLIEKLNVKDRNAFVMLLPEIMPMTMDSIGELKSAADSSFRRFTYGLVVSLDLSATRLEGFTDPGTMVGLIGEYRLNRNWVLQSGLAYSTKIYSALGSEYDTPDWALNAPEDFASVFAKCLVIDIPINAKRYFGTKKGNQWFLAGGISSYFMLREDYTYEYATSRPAWPNTWRYENLNNHFFGILNISGGVVRPLTKKLNVNIEPFMKLPLTGIGQGNVKFLSFGTNVSFTFK